MMYVFPFDIQIEGLHVENCSKKKKVVTDLKETKKGRKKLKNTNFT